MLRASQILVRSFALALCAASLGACGQRGPLYLPTAPEAAQRATLLELGVDPGRIHAEAFGTGGAPA